MPVPARSSPTAVLLSDGTSVEVRRYRTMTRSLQTLLPLLAEPVLDFGCGNGLSMFALIDLGVQSVIGVEPDAARVERGKAALSASLQDPDRLLYVPDTRQLPFGDSHFGAVLAQAVLEHIPQPRAEYIREIWRVVMPGGHLIIAETPNKYLPLDYHTTKRWLVPWLPRRLAYRYAKARGWSKTWKDWLTSGWRGLGHYELISALPHGSYTYIAELNRPRHRILHWVGLPAGLIDPYPLWVLKKRLVQRQS